MRDGCAEEDDKMRIAQEGNILSNSSFSIRLFKLAKAIMPTQIGRCV